VLPAYLSYNSILPMVPLSAAPGIFLKEISVFINNAGAGNDDIDVYTRYKICMDTNVVGPAVRAINGGAYHASKAAFNMIALREHHACVDKGLKVFAMSPDFVVWNLRGTSEELRIGWGKAGPVSVAGETLLNMLDSKRNADM